MTHQRSRHGRLAATASVAALVLLTIIPASIARGATELAIITRATGLQALTQVTNAGDGTNRLFLVEKRGTIRVFENGAVKPGYFLYFDPIDTLSPDVQARWADPAEQDRMVEAAIAAARAQHAASRHASSIR